MRSETSAFCKKTLAICKALDRNDYSTYDLESMADLCFEAVSLSQNEDTILNEHSIPASLSSSIWTLGMSASYCALAIRIIEALDDYGNDGDSALVPLIQLTSELFEREFLLQYAQSDKAKWEIIDSCKATMEKLAQKKNYSSPDLLVLFSLGCLMMETTGTYTLSPDEFEIDSGCLPPILQKRFGQMVATIHFEQSRQALSDLVGKRGIDDSEKRISTLLRQMVSMVLEEQVGASRINKMIDSLEKSVSSLSTGNDDNAKLKYLLVTAIAALEDHPYPLGFHHGLSHIALKAETERVIQEAANLGMDEGEMDLMTELLCMMTIRETQEINELEGSQNALNYIGIIQGLLDRLSSQPLKSKYEDLLSVIVEDLSSIPGGRPMN